MVSASSAMPRLHEPESGVREAAQCGGLGEHGRAAELGEHACGGRADGYGGGAGEELVEILATECALQLDDGGGARERDGADFVAVDPGAAIGHVERCRGVGAIGLHLRDFGAELREALRDHGERAGAGGVQHAHAFFRHGLEGGDERACVGVIRDEVDVPASLAEHLRGGLAYCGDLQALRLRGQLREHRGGGVAAGEHDPVEVARCR